jgi:hypothetical protein
MHRGRASSVPLIDTTTSLVEPLVRGFSQPAAGTTDKRPHCLFIEDRHRQEVGCLLVELEDLARLQAETAPNRCRDGDLAFGG